MRDIFIPAMQLPYASTAGSRRAAVVSTGGAFVALSHVAKMNIFNDARVLRRALVDH